MPGPHPHEIFQGTVLSDFSVDRAPHVYNSSILTHHLKKGFSKFSHLNDDLVDLAPDVKVASILTNDLKKERFSKLSHLNDHVLLRGI